MLPENETAHNKHWETRLRKTNVAVLTEFVAESGFAQNSAAV